ncbi:MAG: class I SAM-dependent methyltransferase [Anaerolineae bacterium]|nr:class I SAM-dependent methyltransferase [Anaerolineae bacterium]
MPDHQKIYRQSGLDYEQLVAREDYAHNLLPAIRNISPLAGLDVVELGAGTGRLTCMLASEVRFLSAFDISGHMLGVAAAKLRNSGLRNWALGIADHRQLPLKDRVTDLVISGWSICYLVDDTFAWQQHVMAALFEMRRVLRPGGVIVIVETLGTGYTEPHIYAKLKPYYALLEQEGFQSTWLRTDYRFESFEEAESLSRFFFGADLAEQVIRNHWVELPECTGIWWLRS